jgi:hypothetical protein
MNDFLTNEWAEKYDCRRSFQQGVSRQNAYYMIDFNPMREYYFKIVPV